MSQYDGIRAVLYELEVEVSNNPNLQSIKEEVTALLDRVSLQADDADNTIDFSFTSPEAAEMLKKTSMIYGSNPIDVARNGLGRNNLLYISLVLSHLSTRDTLGGAIPISDLSPSRNPRLICTPILRIIWQRT
jgi:hypothetical protein